MDLGEESEDLSSQAQPLGKTSPQKSHNRASLSFSLVFSVFVLNIKVWYSLPRLEVVIFLKKDCGWVLLQPACRQVLKLASFACLAKLHGALEIDMNVESDLMRIMVVA